MMAHCSGKFVNRLKGACLLRDVALYHSHYLTGIYGYIVLAHTVVGSEHGNGFSVPTIVLGLVGIVQETRIGIVETVVLQDDALGQAGNGGDDAASRGKIGSTFAILHLVVRHLYHGPVHRTVESVPQPLGHVTEVHVLIVNLLQIDMLAKVLIGRKRCPKLDGMRCSHIALYTLAR